MPCPRYRTIYRTIISLAFITIKICRSPLRVTRASINALPSGIQTQLQGSVRGIPLLGRSSSRRRGIFRFLDGLTWVELQKDEAEFMS